MYHSVITHFAAAKIMKALLFHTRVLPTASSCTNDLMSSIAQQTSLSLKFVWWTSLRQKPCLWRVPLLPLWRKPRCCPPRCVATVVVISCWASSYTLRWYFTIFFFFCKEAAQKKKNPAICCSHKKCSEEDIRTPLLQKLASFLATPGQKRGQYQKERCSDALLFWELKL